MWRWSVPDFHDEPNTGAGIYRYVFGIAANRGQFHLPIRGWKLCGASIHLGVSGSFRGRKPDGTCGDVDFYSVDIRVLHITSRNCKPQTWTEGIVT